MVDVIDGRQWHNFVVEFLAKSNKMAEYFNVPNKFKHIRQGEFDLIQYD